MWRKSMGLWIRILIGLVAGMVVGVYFGPQAALLKPLGTIFLNLISMIIVPLVLSSIVIGVTSVRNNKKIGRLAVKTIFMFTALTVTGVLLGAMVASFFNIGSSLNMVAPTVSLTSGSPTLGEMMLGLVPQNPVSALVEGNILQIIVFAIFLGVAINMTGERGRPLVELFESLADVLYKLTSIIMEFSPLGVFAIAAWVSGSFGFSIVYVQLKFLGLYFAACIIFVLAVFCSILWFGAKVRPWPLFKGMADALALAFATCSSSATLPTSMICIQRNVGVSRNIASFVMPLGSILNMNGAAIFQGMGAVFVAQAYGIEFGWSGILLLVVTAMLSVSGAAGVPGAGFLMLSYVFTMLGLPLEGLVLFIGIDRARDMCSTMLNTFGGAVCATYIARKEGELDERLYYSERIVILEGDEV